MARKAATRQPGQDADVTHVPVATSSTVKVTLHLSVATAQRLGVESAMRRISQSAIAEEVLANYLSRWVLPTVPDANQREAG